MTKTFDYLIIFCVGLTAGVLGSREYFKTKYESWARDEVDSVIKHAFSKDKNDNSEENSTPDNQKKVVVNDFSEKTDVDATDYRNFYEKKGDIYGNKESLEVNMAMKEHPREKDGPYLISEEDYSETELSFDKMSCTFYVPDRLIVDDLSREAVEPDVIGVENIEYLVKTENKFVYIRNELLGCDLEISRDESSVAETGDVVWRE